MHKFIKALLRILDGHPTAKKAHQRGQSALELALVSPLLVMLVLGIVEIGWYANNILNFEEITRGGARRGAALSGDMAPEFWNNDASFPARDDGVLARAADPNVQYPVDYTWWGTWVTNYILNEYGLADTDPDYTTQYNEITIATKNYRDVACTNAETQAYYNVIVCSMLSAMADDNIDLKNDSVRPFDRVPAPHQVGNPPDYDANDYRRPELDDIVVSVFSLAAINNGDRGLYADQPDVAKRTLDFDNEVSVTGTYTPSPGWQVVVVGRYPTNANECNVKNDGSVLSKERDPFDYINNGLTDETPDSWNNPTQPFLELPGIDVGMEFHRGFSWRGLHRVEDTRYTDYQCYGSEWSMADVEELMQLSVLNLNSTQQAFLPNHGLVLVEMFWRHDLLLQVPFTTQIFSFLGSDSNDIYINVWSAFPALAAEPNIIYGPVGD